MSTAVVGEIRTRFATSLHDVHGSFGARQTRPVLSRRSRMFGMKNKKKIIIKTKAFRTRSKNYSVRSRGVVAKKSRPRRRRTAALSLRTRRDIWPAPRGFRHGSHTRDIVTELIMRSTEAVSRLSSSAALEMRGSSARGRGATSPSRRHYTVVTHIETRVRDGITRLWKSIADRRFREPVVRKTRGKQTREVYNVLRSSIRTFRTS